MAHADKHLRHSIAIEPLITPEQSELLRSLQKCCELRDMYMFKSRQRLGDDPRDYDGEFEGLPEEHVEVCSRRPDIDVATERSRVESPFAPWKIYPKPPSPTWHPKNKEVLKHNVSDEESFEFEACEIPESHPWTFEIDDKGVYQVFKSYDGSKSSTTCQ